jgi:hypothetical protein
MFTQDFRAWKYQPVEIPIPSGSTAQSFTVPNQQSLYNKIIKAVELYTVSAMPYSPLTFGNTIANADFIKGYFEFFDGSNQQVNRIPFAALNNIRDATPNPYRWGLFLCKDWQVSWDKCKIDFATAVGTTNVIVTLGVYYEDSTTVRPIQ